MRFVCRTRVALLCRVLRSVSLLFFSLKSLFFFLSKQMKKGQKKLIKLFWGLLTKTRKYRKRLPFRPWEKTVTPDRRHSFVWFGTCAQVLSFFCSSCVRTLSRSEDVVEASLLARDRRARVVASMKKGLKEDDYRGVILLFL